MRTVKCCHCQRRFDEKTAIPVRIVGMGYMGRYVVQEIIYKPACPRCMVFCAPCMTGRPVGQPCQACSDAAKEVTP